VDVVSYHFIMGSYESGYCHGMGDRLVVRKCHLHSRTPSPQFFMLIRIVIVVTAQLHYRYVPICRCVCSGE
jgi:hypothetical protein